MNKRKWNEINHWKTGKDRLTDAGQVFLLGWGFFICRLGTQLDLKGRRYAASYVLLRKT